MQNEPENRINDFEDINDYDNSESSNAITLDNPVKRASGTYLAQFESIRQIVFQDVQRECSLFCMNVQKLVKACVSANLEIYNLAKIHANNIKLRLQSLHPTLLNYTVTNAMYDLNGVMFMVDFDLSKPSQAILNAKYMQEVKFSNTFDCIFNALLAKTCQILMTVPINEDICIKYQELEDRIRTLSNEIGESRRMLIETIQRRAFTAFEFKPGLSFYTLNYSPDMSMLFWDRYTISDITVKSYYVEQHCIIEHVVTGEVEPERFIMLHKPSKNSMAAFLANKLAGLTEMIRPQPTNLTKAAYEQGDTELPEYEEE